MSDGPNIWQAPPHKQPEPKQTVRPEWSFFWKTSLSNQEMDEICAWLRTLTPEQRRFMDELARDQRNQQDFDNAGAEQ